MGKSVSSRRVPQRHETQISPVAECLRHHRRRGQRERLYADHRWGNFGRSSSAKGHPLERRPRAFNKAPVPLRGSEPLSVNAHWKLLHNLISRYWPRCYQPARLVRGQLRPYLFRVPFFAKRQPSTTELCRARVWLRQLLVGTAIGSALI